MRRQFTAVVVLAFALANATAAAQSKGQGKATAGPQVRYFDLSASIFGELGSEAILTEKHRGATLVSAELEVCHLVSPTSNRLDRFVVPLKVEGNRLAGTAQSQERKHAISVDLIRRGAAGHVTFEGTVTSGTETETVSATDDTEMPEDDITDQYLAEPVIESSPLNFSTAWPQSLHVRVGRAKLAGLLEVLRDQNVRVVFNGLIPSCRVLRSGSYLVQVDVEAERVGAMLATLKIVPGVTEVGFSPTPPNMQRAVRFPSAGWRDAAGKLERDKLAAAVAAAMAKAMSATLTSTSWDAMMGELTIELKRPDDTVADFKLAQIVTVTMVIAPESLFSNRQSILWIESIAARIVDERPPPRLTLSLTQPDEGGEGQANEPEGSESLADAVAAALNGAPWDSDKQQWRQ